MLLFRKIFSIIILSGCLLPGKASVRSLTFDVLNYNTGLSVNNINAIFQDSEGFIWIGSDDGLVRHDGYKSKSYKSNMYTPDLLTNNTIRSIAEDDRNRLWIATHKGLNVFDKTANTFASVKSDVFGEKQISKVVWSGSGYVWVGTKSGLFQYYPDLDSARVFLPVNRNDRSVSGTDIMDIIIDTRQRVWITSWGRGLCRYDSANDEFIRYPVPNPAYSAYSLFEDRDGNIWLGSWGYGLYRLVDDDSPETVSYVNYRHDPAVEGSVSEDVILSINQDLRYGCIWTGTRNGLSILTDPQNPASFVNYLNHKCGEALKGDNVASIFRDRSGIMWLGLNGGGINKVNLEKFKLEHKEIKSESPAGNAKSILIVYEDKRGVLWLGTFITGLYLYFPDENGGKYVHASRLPYLNAIPHDMAITEISYVGKRNEIWLSGRNRGIIVVSLDSDGNPSGCKWSWETPVHGINKVIGMAKVFEDSKGNIWTSPGYRFFVIKPDDKKLTLPLPDYNNSKDVNLLVNDITEDSDGNIWIATNVNGIYRVRYDSATDEFDVSAYNKSNGKINSNNVFSPFCDSDGKIWAGTNGGGLNLYDPLQDKFVSMNESMNISADNIFNIFQSDDGGLWMCSNDRLIQFRSDAPAMTYTSNNGVFDNIFIPGSYAKGRNGLYYFGGRNGYNIFDYKNLSYNTYIPDVRVTDIEVSGKSVFEHGFGKYLRNNTNSISIDHDDQLKIEFASLSYANPRNNKYAYMLEGVDKDWVWADAGSRTANYTGLKKGDYVFRVKASNENGIWNEIPTELKIRVKPSVFDTWYAYLAYAVLGLVVIYFSYRYVSSKIRWRNEVKMAELERATANELNTMKLQFFTNLSHELLTPLSILSCSVEELESEGNVKGSNITTMKMNIERLLRLLRQLLEFRKAESGNLKLETSYGDISAFVGNICNNNFLQLFTKKKLHLSLVSDPESIKGRFDSDKLDKILYNLISNAVKYNKEGGFVHVTLSEITVEGERRASIQVSDSGIGIPEEKINRIFERFYDGDYRRSNTYGTGIGLSLTRDLITLHKGTVSVESEPGQGATFRIEFPIDASAYTADEVGDYVKDEQPAVPADTPEAEMSGGRLNVLLAEDDEELTALITRLLSPEYNLIVANNGKEALDIVRNNSIDLIVSDIMMPVMDGLALCRELRADIGLCHIPVILLTAKSTEEDRVVGYDSGADAYITKPFSMKVLRSRIVNLLASKNRLKNRFREEDVIRINEITYTSLDEKFMEQAVKTVEGNLDNSDFGFEEFADSMGMSKSTLYRKIKVLTGMPTNDFIKNIRLKYACKLIREKQTSIAETAYAVGFDNPKYFSACFKKEFGMQPSEYARRYSQNKG